MAYLSIGTVRLHYRIYSKNLLSCIVFWMRFILLLMGVILKTKIDYFYLKSQEMQLKRREALCPQKKHNCSEKS